MFWRDRRTGQEVYCAQKKKILPSFQNLKTKNNWLHVCCPLTPMLTRTVALALVGSAAAFSPMMSVDLGRRSIVQAGAASAVAAPLLRPQEAQAGLPVDALCAGKACNSAPVLPSPPSWANVWCHSWPRTEVVYSLRWPGHHHLRSPRVQARGAERGVHRRSCRRRGRRDVRQGMIPAMATGVLVFDLLN